MKKIFNILICFLAIILLAGCEFNLDFGNNDNDEEKHTHEYPSTWEYDETYHYKKCIDESCETVLKEEHKFENDKCSVCGYDKSKPIEETHVHEYPSTWEYDESYHYKNCVNQPCNTVLKEEHTFDQNNECTICHYKKDGEPTIIYYTVIFKDYDGLEITTQTVQKGKAATAPTMTSTETRIFKEWDVDFSNVQSDLVVTAVYDVIQTEFTISYNLNGGDWNCKNKQEYIYQFLCDFYDFVAPNVDLDTFIYDTNMDYKGTWSSYIGGSVGNTNRLLAENNIDVDNNDYFFNSAAYKTKYYALASYVKNQICGSNKRFGSSNTSSYEYGALDFYRYIIDDPYNYVDIYGGEDVFHGYPVTEVTPITSYTVGDTFLLPVPNSASFDHWENTKTGEKISQINANTTGDLSLKAVWKNEVVYKIIFNTDGGNQIQSLDISNGETFTLPTPTKEGYKFLGWYYNGVLFTATKFYYHTDITVIASWRDESKVELENLVYDGNNVTYRNSTTVVQIPTDYVQKDTQLRACWVSSFAGDFSPSTNKTTMMNNLTEVLNIMEAFNMNCVIFHIRTHNQAFYKTHMTYISSNYGTYSSFETWDYLTWFISECHKRGIEFHAWLNPYRISSGGASSLQSAASDFANYPDNPASDPANMLINSDGAVILNPGLQNVRDFIVDICLEIMHNYDVDAIHFDDYFYVKGIDDSSTMAANNPKKLNESDWRRSQVDAFIEQLSAAMREYNIENNKHVQLGISPTGIYRNGNGTVDSGSNSSGYAHYGSPLYADTLHWIREGWIDYIMPQIYWGFTLNAAGFAAVSDWWNLAVAGTGVNFYAGMGLYMSMSSGNASWGSQQYEASNQILYTTKLDNCQGISFYKWASLREAYQNSNKISHNGVLRIKNEYWTSYVPTPSTMSTNYNYKNVN